MNLYSINVSGEAIGSNVAETLIQGVASNVKNIELVRWAVSFNGATSTDAPVLVELLRLTSPGTSSAFVPIKLDPSDDAAIMTARSSHTAEPIAGDVIEKHYVSPAGGLLYVQYAPDERIKVSANGRVGIRVLAANAVNVSADLIFAE